MGDLSPDDVELIDQTTKLNGVEIIPSVHNIDNILIEKEILLFGNEKEIKVEPVIEPKIQDRCHLVYLILLIHGIGVLMPWNMFINAKSYFVDYKLNETNEDGSVDEMTKTYRIYFLSCLGFVSQIPNVLSAALNLFCQCKRGSPRIRIFLGIIIGIIMLVLTIVLAMLDTSSWKVTFFWITMVIVVIINVANGVYQNSIYGIAAYLPFKYTNAVILGSNTSGLVTSIIAIVAKAAAPDPRASAVYYFLAAIVVLIIAFDSYFALPLLPFYRHHFKKASERKEVSSEDGESYMTKYFIVIKKCWVHLLSVFFVFFVTLSCFPAIQADIKSINFIIPEKYFTLVTCFLFFNLFAVVGSLLTEFVKQPGPKYVWIPVLLRVLFIPFFLLCNFRPDERNIDPVFVNDYVYCTGSILLALTSGYFSSLCMMYAPSNVEEKYKGIAGMMAAFCLILGVFCGIVFTFPLIYAIEKNGGSGQTTVAPIFNISSSSNGSLFEFTTLQMVT